jgi:peptide deformylase
MAVLNILTGENNPILRTPTLRAAKVTKDILKILKDMEETTIASNGLGIAGPQVGQSLRICIVKIGDKLQPLINPDITWRSTEMTVAEEGCLSLPGIWKEIARPAAITVRYLDAKGREQERRLTDLDARVVQHEVDHLEGKLIVDYPAPIAQKIAL